MRKLLGLFLIALLVSSVGISIVSGDEIEIPKPPGEEIIFIPGPGPLPVGFITIRGGWNLVAMPVLPDKPYTIKRFIEAVEGKPRGSLWEVSVVAVYKDGRFKRYPMEGYSYNMVPGEAYFVHANLVAHGLIMVEGWQPSTIVEIIGRPIDHSISLNLNRGWNGVSLRGDDTLDAIQRQRDKTCEDSKHLAVLSLSQFLERLAEQEIKATKIAFWSDGGGYPAQVQHWEIFDLPLQKEIDRLIRADEGFFLLCEENGLYIPGLDSNKEEPWPPIPPEPDPTPWHPCDTEE